MIFVAQTISQGTAGLFIVSSLFITAGVSLRFLRKVKNS